jgi:uncharacterized repeat protein (TIGR03803 family)
LGCILACALLCAAATLAFATDTEKVLTSFSGPDGRDPISGLVRDARGNFYGTSNTGGFPNCAAEGSCGTIYRVSPRSNGTWHKTVLHRFKGTEGGNPAGALILDSAGNLYGTTNLGGNTKCTVGTFVGCGTVFELSPGANKVWTLKTLHRFVGTDGSGPASTLVFDKKGNLYGTTQTNGANDAGTVFQLHPQSNGAWTLKTLHNFTGTDGLQAAGALVFDSAGNLYGTTRLGGTNDTGTVFKLSPNSDGSWTESVLVNFGTSGGVQPIVGVIFDSAGNLFGTTSTDGSVDGSTFGNVFELTPNSDGSWTRITVHTFTGDEGSTAEGIAFDASGNLVGFLLFGISAHSGIVYQLAQGSWAFSELYVFTDTPDGTGPVGVPVIDSSGNIYGATEGGGTSGLGAVFEVSPGN